METVEQLHKSDWVRFQVPDRRVLEGYVQDIVKDRILIGKTPDGPENQWWNIADIGILKHQAIHESE